MNRFDVEQAVFGMCDIIAENYELRKRVEELEAEVQMLRMASRERFEESQRQVGAILSAALHAGLEAERKAE